MNTLTIENLGKRYGDTWAVQNIDLTVEPGVVGVLGPNGAGKSTLMRVITSVIKPTEGTVYWNGTDVTRNPQAMRRKVGYLPQSFGVYPNLTASEFLSYLAAIRGVSDAGVRIDELLRLVNLAEDRDQRLGGFSGGMRQCVGIAQVLLADPDLLVVHEHIVSLIFGHASRLRDAVVGGESLGKKGAQLLSQKLCAYLYKTVSSSTEYARPSDG